MARCKECGQEFPLYRKGVANSMMRTPTKPITEETGNITQCHNPDCDFENEFQNWCKQCQSWYLAEQPDRGDENIQCPYCRAEVKRIKAIEVMNENNG